LIRFASDEFAIDDVETAFFAVRRFPPPAASTYIFAGLNGAGAGLASYGRVAFFVQRIERHLMIADVLPDITL
jgi:hypothetical protein